MTRLAVFTDTYDDVNGVAVIYRQLVAQAGRDEHHITIYAPASSDAVIDRPGARVRLYRTRPRIGLPRYRLQKIGWVPLRRVARDVARGEHDVALVATPGPMGFAGRAIARRRGLPLVGFYHTRFPVYLSVYAAALVPGGRGTSLAERIGFRVMRQLYGDCDLVLMQSPAMGDEVRRATDAPQAVWETGVDLERFSPGDGTAFRSRHGIPSDACVVLYVGRLAAEKRLDVLAALSRRMTEHHFLVVGDGPYAPTLRAIARATFTGFLTGDDLAAAFRAGDVFLFPSTTDTWGNVLSEAMATGLPLVVVDDGPPAELVARTGAGVSFPGGDLDGAEAALRGLLDDPSRRRTMGEAARRYASTSGWPEAYRRFIDLCASAVGIAGSPPSVGSPGSTEPPAGRGLRYRAGRGGDGER